MNEEKVDNTEYKKTDPLTEAFEKKIYDLKNLINLGISMASNLEFDSLVESILFSCIGQLVVDKVSILLQINIDEDYFKVHMSKGYDAGESVNTVFINETSQLIKHLKRHPEPHDMKSLLEMPELVKNLELLKPLSPSLIVPMKSKNFINGIIILSNKITGEHYSANEKEFMLDLAKFAAIAVENSRLYIMATHDRMTKLFIHHYFQERLLEELKRSQRDSTPICLIMADIDHFKKFNDTYGHQQGDSVIIETAKLIKKHIRDIDVAARYGGEEFTIILPRTELHDALQVAERLREGIMEHKFPGKDEPLSVTISLGVTEFNQEKDKDKKGFIERTDKALYEAKKRGRNRVVSCK